MVVFDLAEGLVGDHGACSPSRLRNVRNSRNPASRESPRGPRASTCETRSLIGDEPRPDELLTGLGQTGGVRGPASGERRIGVIAQLLRVADRDQKQVVR